MATDKNQQLPVMGRGDTAKGPVECLGMTFPNDEARRAYFTEKLREKLRDPEFRKIEGFPAGEDDDILALSDPPYYTACPNPFVASFVARKHPSGSVLEPYERTPYAADVTEGKQDSICMAHTYHTKVPYRAIARYILHYTNPGDVVLDAFAGTGMTALAAQFLAKPDAAFVRSIENERSALGHPQPRWGARDAVLFDISPFATFLSRGFNSDLSAETFVAAAQSLVSDSETATGWMYGGSTGRARTSYVVWGDVLFCDCGAELSLWEPVQGAGGSLTLGAVGTCPKCHADLAVQKLQRAHHTYLDSFLGQTITQNRQRILLVEESTSAGVRRRVPTTADFDLIARTEAEGSPGYCPTQAMMFKNGNWGDMFRSGYHFGVSHAHHFWTRRNLLILADLFQRASSHRHAHEMRFVCTSFAVKTGSRMHNIGLKAGNINLAGQTYNTLQLTGLSAERNLFVLGQGKIADLQRVFELPKRLDRVAISTCSATNLIGVPDSSVDYVFVDPPFGKNIIYSELSFLYECWLKVFTNQGEEAIVSTAQGKGLPQYQSLMSSCFRELYRVLKPERWLTVAFHNSKSAVWNAIQEALGQAGFVVADVRIIDKGQGTFKQMTTQGAVDKDLAISAYRPSTETEQLMSLSAGSADAVWAFTRDHMRKVPVFVPSAGFAEQLAERTKYLLFDRMVAFHVQHGLSLPLSAGEYYQGLDQRFPERDGMYFLPNQVAEYEQKRGATSGIEQLDLFVSDERSAIQWVRRQLQLCPMAYRDLAPLYMKEAQRVWEKHEQPLELATILEQNFLPSDTGKWRVPDPKREGDLEQLRHKALWKEFEQYRQSKGKLKVVRTEALRAGFKESWQKQDYGTIVQMAKRVPDAVIQEDPALLMYYDNALMRTEG